MSVVYILKSLKNNRYYIGSTMDFIRRLSQHQRGKVISTKNNRPFKVMLIQQYNSITKAKQIEYKLKRLKRKDYIEKIVLDGYIKIT